jgi:hypothetical protein
MATCQAVIAALHRYRVPRQLPVKEFYSSDDHVFEKK